MEIILFRNFQKRKNSTLTPNDAAGETRTVYLKTDTDILNPSFIVSGVDYLVNYVKFENRYYFVTGITADNLTQMTIHCSVDVLASWKADIYNAKAYIKYSSTGYDINIIDERLTIEKYLQDSHPQRIKYGNDDLFNTTGCFLLKCVSIQANGSAGPVALYAMTETQMSLFNSRFNNADFITQLKDAYTNPFEPVIDVKWIPVDRSYFLGGDDGNIVLGNLVMEGVTGKLINPLPITGQVTSMYIPPLLTPDFRAKSQFTTAYAYLPFVGVVPLDIDPIYPDGEYNMDVSLDPMTGDVLYILKTDEVIISTYSGNCSTNIPISKTTFENPMGMVTGTISAIGGVATAFINPAVGAGMAAGGVLSALKSAELHTTINGAISSRLGTKPGLRIQVVSLTPEFIQDYDNADRIARVGLPVHKVDTIGNYSGYMETEGASVSIAGLESEKDAINAALDGGIYIEGSAPVGPTIDITSNGRVSVRGFDYANVNVQPEVSGTLEITSNNLYNVAQYARVDVNVPQGVFPTGTLEISENGNYDISLFANVLVAVSGGGGLPDNIVMGDMTPQSNLTEYTVSHDKGIVPVAALLYADDLQSTSTYLHTMSLGIQGQDGNINACMSYNQYNGSRASIASNYGGISAMTDTQVTFNTRGGNYVMKSGFLYHYILLFKEV